jgi:hypothetical protein
MLRKIAIGVAVAAIAMGGATLSASARGEHGGGGPHGGFAKMGGYGKAGGFERHHHHWGGRGRGGYYSYGGYGGGSCWRRTPEGRVWVCGGGYGGGYGGYGYEWRHRHQPGHAFGMHGGGRRVR